MSGTPSMQKGMNELADRFTGFDKEVERLTAVRQEAEESKLQSVRDSLQKVEKTLANEQKRRAEANKALQAMFESHLEMMRERLENTFNEKINQLQGGFDNLMERSAALENALAAEREERIRDANDTTGQITRQLNDLQNSFETEKVARLERETQIVKRVGDDLFRMQEKLDAERVARESTLTILREELDEGNRARNKSAERIQTLIMEEIASLKNGLLNETQSREEADESIVTALNEYTKTLQDSLRVVNTLPQ